MLNYFFTIFTISLINLALFRKKIDARNPSTGEVVFKCNMEHSIAGLTHVKHLEYFLFHWKLFKLFTIEIKFLKCDYKLDGIEQLICCSVEGEVKGYKAMPAHLLNMSTDRNVNQEAIRDMSTRKQVNRLSF